MEVTLVVIGVAVALAAAFRSTWSPCGQSMLSSITPFSEASRGARFAWTASWFVVGAVIGGVTLGLGAMVLALGVNALDLSVELRLGIAAALALVAAGSDAKVLGMQLPFHIRQVNEDWLSRYRPWVYGLGFGWQIGVGVGTFIMTAGVYLLVALAALSASPVLALVLCTLFGFARGLGVLPARSLTTPQRLRDFHRRFDALGPASRTVMVVVQCVAAVVAAVAAWGPLVGLCVAALCGIVTAVRVRPGARRAPAVVRVG